MVSLEQSIINDIGHRWNNKVVDMGLDTFMMLDSIPEDIRQDVKCDRKKVVYTLFGLPLRIIKGMHGYVVLERIGDGYPDSPLEFIE